MRFLCAYVTVLLFCGYGLPAQSQDKPAPGIPLFDSTRDAALDIETAIAEAQRSKKRIILEVGGDWCAYCQELDKVFQHHASLLRFRDTNFIVVNVYYSPDNKNQQALSRYSKVLGIPHFFVLESDGTLLHSQHVLELKAEGSYSPDKIREFLVKWSKPER